MSNIQNITEQFKGLSAEELLTIIAAATAEAKKAVKIVAKAPKEAKEKKGSMPKGVSPWQLDKPRKWVDFVLKRSNEVGWPVINVKDTETLPASVERDGKHVFEATGKPLNNKQAMSLSKQYWARKEAVGTNKELYDEFEAQYVPPAPAAPKEAESDAESEASEASVESAPKEKKEKKVKKTEEEKEAEKAAKKEAAALKKAQEKEAKEAAKKEAAALKKAAPKAEAPKAVAAAKPVAMKLKKAAPKVEELPFDIEADTMVHEWVFQGKKVYVNSDGEMWERSDSDEAGKWMGKYYPSTKILDTTANEPLYADEE
jgi:colicin import membrane protein